MLVDVRDDCLPTPENINALQFPLRLFIQHLETMAHPAVTVRQNILLRAENQQLRAALVALKHSP